MNPTSVALCGFTFLCGSLCETLLVFLTHAHNPIVCRIDLAGLLRPLEPGSMPIWIPITVAAALFQCWRTAMQQKLRHLLSVNGAGFVRYLYGAPTAFVLLIAALIGTGLPVPQPNPAFL